MCVFLNITIYSSVIFSLLVRLHKEHVNNAAIRAEEQIFNQLRTTPQKWRQISKKAVQLCSKWPRLVSQLLRNKVEPITVKHVDSLQMLLPKLKISTISRYSLQMLPKLKISTGYLLQMLISQNRWIQMTMN